jgi:Resolvase, N terminal domain/Helix-turn-helix domain of resolvase
MQLDTGRSRCPKKALSIGDPTSCFYTYEAEQSFRPRRSTFLDDHDYDRFLPVSRTYPDTATATGQLVFHIFGALAEFERNLINERTMAGLEAARARGRTGGRPRLKSAAGKVAMAKKLYRDRTLSIPEICKTLNISKATLYRWVNAGGGNVAKP